MKPLSASEIERILVAHGFRLTRQKGSHKIYRHDGLGVSVPVPFHGKKKPLPIGTFMAIVKQSKISRDQFKK